MKFFEDPATGLDIQDIGPAYFSQIGKGIKTFYVVICFFTRAGLINEIYRELLFQQVFQPPDMNADATGRRGKRAKDKYGRFFVQCGKLLRVFQPDSR